MLSKTERHYLVTGLVLSTGESPRPSYEQTLLANIRRKAELALSDFGWLAKDTRFADIVGRLQRTSGYPVSALDLGDEE